MDVDRDAPAVAKAEIEVAAPPEAVWSLITDVERWPSWNPDVKSVTLDGDFAPGSTFRWKAGPSTIVSTVREVDPPREVALDRKDDRDPGGARPPTASRARAERSSPRRSPGPASSFALLRGRMATDRSRRAWKPALRHLKAEAERAPILSEYDAIAGLYDEWSRSVVEDVGFYVEEARKAGGPVVELGVGNGTRGGTDRAGRRRGDRRRLLARDARRLPRACRGGGRRATSSTYASATSPTRPWTSAFASSISPFRAFLHLDTDEARLGALRAVRELLVPGGRFVFDVFAPARRRHRGDARTVARARAWDLGAGRLEPGASRPDARRPRRAAEATLALAWLEPERWRELVAETGLEVVAEYGWFDRRPYRGGEDTSGSRSGRPASERPAARRSVERRHRVRLGRHSPPIYAVGLPAIALHPLEHPGVVE